LWIDLFLLLQSRASDRPGFIPFPDLWFIASSLSSFWNALTSTTLDKTGEMTRINERWLEPSQQFTSVKDLVRWVQHVDLALQELPREIEMEVLPSPQNIFFCHLDL
jgi:hypothetical protein